MALVFLSLSNRARKRVNANAPELLARNGKRLNWCRDDELPESDPKIFIVEPPPKRFASGRVVGDGGFSYTSPGESIRRVMIVCGPNEIRAARPKRARRYRGTRFPTKTSRDSRCVGLVTRFIVRRKHSPSSSETKRSRLSRAPEAFATTATTSQPDGRSRLDVRSREPVDCGPRTARNESIVGRVNNVPVDVNNTVHESPRRQSDDD